MLDTVATAFETHTPLTVAAFRLGAACALGMVIGLDRESRRHPAGLRTHTLTALGAALITLCGLEFIEAYAADDDRTQFDPIRILNALVPALAILSAASIFHTQHSVKGMTTGISLWLSGAVGIACGAGQLSFAIAAVLLSIGILFPLRVIERRMFDRDEKETKHKD